MTHRGDPRQDVGQTHQRRDDGKAGKDDGGVGPHPECSARVTNETQLQPAAQQRNRYIRVEELQSGEFDQLVNAQPQQP